MTWKTPTKDLLRKLHVTSHPLFLYRDRAVCYKDIIITLMNRVQLSHLLIR